MSTTLLLIGFSVWLAFTVFAFVFPRWKVTHRLFVILKPPIGDHDTDRALRQPFSLIPSIIFSIIVAGSMLVVIYVTLYFLSYDALTSTETRITAPILKKLGLANTENALKSEIERVNKLLNPDKKTESSNETDVKVKNDWNKKLTDELYTEICEGHLDTGVELSSDTMKILRTYILAEWGFKIYNSENQNSISGANAAIQYLFLFISSTDTNNNPSLDSENMQISDLSKYLVKNYHKIAMEPLSPRQFFTSLEGYDSSISNGIPKIMTNIHSKIDPSSKALILALLDRFSDIGKPYRRIYSLFIGPIQFVTFICFFLAIVLLSGRRYSLSQQEKSEEFFERFVYENLSNGNNLFGPNSEKTEGSLKNHRDINPLFPKPNLPYRTEISRLHEYAIIEKNLLKRFFDYCRTLKKETRVHLFFPALLKNIWKELSGTEKKQAVRIEASRNLTHSVVERNEAKLQRTEYSVIEYLLWAMPSLGFIGTILGISLALGSADQVVRATDVMGQATAISAVTGVLGIAFDTTLVALICCIPVMFLLYRYRSAESHYLLEVERQVQSHLLTYGHVDGTNKDVTVVEEVKKSKIGS